MTHKLEAGVNGEKLACVNGSRHKVLAKAATQA